MNSIKEQVDHGAYRVDPHAVAEAILRRLNLRTGLIPPPVPGQGAGCSASE